MEFKITPDRLGLALRTIREAAKEVDSVFVVDVYTRVGPRLSIPEEILDIIEAEGYTRRPNAKINMGLGRANERKDA
jgi:hypothetical protein